MLALLLLCLLKHCAGARLACLPQLQPTLIANTSILPTTHRAQELLP